MVVVVVVEGCWHWLRILRCRSRSLFVCVFVGRREESKGLPAVCVCVCWVRELVVMEVTRLVRRRERLLLAYYCGTAGGGGGGGGGEAYSSKHGCKKETKTCHVNAYILIYFIPVRDPFSVVLLLPLPSCVAGMVGWTTRRILVAENVPCPVWFVCVCVCM